MDIPNGPNMAPVMHWNGLDLFAQLAANMNSPTGSHFSRALLVLVALLASTASLRATSYWFQPSDADLADLDHHNAYMWGISSTALRNELMGDYVISSASITIYNIWDWKKGEPDILYINLLDDTKKPSSGNVTVFSGENPYDNVANGNYFGLARPTRYQGTSLLTTWTDPVGGSSQNFNFVYNLSAANLDLLMDFIMDPTHVYGNGTGNMFGLGFDPECHYFNSGIKLKIETRKVPETGATALMCGLGLAAIGLVRCVRRRSAAT